MQSQMKKFSFMFGVYLGEMILRHSDNLSKTSNTICAAEGHNVAGMVVRTLEKLRSSEAFDLFWQKVIDSSETHGVGEPALPIFHVRCLKSMRMAMQCVKFTMNLKPIFDSNIMSN